MLAGESTYAELAIEIGVVGLALFIAWNGALLVALARQGRQVAVAAWLAAALATVLALAVQTDVLGVPWLAFCLWAFAGSAVQLAGAERAVLGGDVIRQPAGPVRGARLPCTQATRPLGKATRGRLRSTSGAGTLQRRRARTRANGHHARAFGTWSMGLEAGR